MAAPMWEPGIQVETLEGPSGRRLARQRLAVLGASLVLLAIFAVGMAVTREGYLSSPFLSVVLLTIVGTFVTEVVLAIRARRRFRLEADAGYTTSTGRYLHLPEVDVETRCVVRLPGEDALSASVYVERMALIKESLARTTR